MSLPSFRVLRDLRERAQNARELKSASGARSASNATAPKSRSAGSSCWNCESRVLKEQVAADYSTGSLLRTTILSGFAASNPMGHSSGDGVACQASSRGRYGRQAENTESICADPLLGPRPSDGHREQAPAAVARLWEGEANARNRAGSQRSGTRCGPGNHRALALRRRCGERARRREASQGQSAARVLAG